MKIGFVYDAIIPAPHYGGIERVMYWLAEELAQRGHHIVFFVRKGSRPQFGELVELSATDWKNFFLKNQKSFNLDFVHFHEPFREKLSTPYLLTVYGNAQPGETYPANTNFVSRAHAKNHDSTVFVYNGIATNLFPFTTSKLDEYVFMATDRRIKNLKTAIDWAIDRKLKLHVIGPKYRNHHGIIYHGPLGEHDGKLEILAKCKAMVCPYNWNEPFAVAPLEMLACGGSLISSANGSLPEVTQPQVGVICHNYSELLNSTEKIKTILPQSCRDFVEQNFSIQKMADGYLALYNRILQDGELNQAPRYNIDPTHVEWLYKPTLLNRLKLGLTGKI